MNVESFSKIAAAIQSIAVAISLILGGWWAAKTFVFQNPAFYENGIQVAGYEPESLLADISLEKLEANKRQYEITLTLTNNSKTLNQVFHPEAIEVLFFRPNQTNGVRAKFISISYADHGVNIPPSESRKLRFLALFPQDGIYVVEVNPCKKFGRNCLTQKYISVNIGSPH